MTPIGEWPPGAPRVLVTDGWLGNAGDAAISVAVDRMIRAATPEAAILHAVYQADEIGPEVPELVVVPALEELLGTPWTAARPGWETDGPSLVADADLLVSQGGGFLIEAYQPWARIAALAAATIAGPRVALLGQTIGPFRGAHVRRDLQTVLSAAELVTVRDPASRNHAIELGGRDVRLGTDLAFELVPHRSRGIGQGIGLVLTDHHVDPAEREGQARVAAELLSVVRRTAPDEEITIWSTVSGHEDLVGEDDGRLAAELVAELAPSARTGVEVVRGYVPPLEAIRLVAGSRALVTMRMHPALFAAGLGLPFGLVLGGQRVGVLADTPVADRVADPSDATAIEALVKRVLEPSAGDLPDIGVLRNRHAETRAALAGLLASLS